MDFSWDQLRDYLLGSPTRGIGLIKRVEARVEEIGSVQLPVLNGGWYIPVSGGLHNRETDDELAERLLSLATGLIEWSGQGIGTSVPGSERQLLQYLRTNRITDVDYLAGKGGRLQQARAEVRSLMATDSPTEADRDRATELMQFLKGWMGDCDHRFERQPSDTDDVQVYRCPCGVSYWQDGDERRAVGG